MNNPDGVYNGLNILTYWGGLNLSRGNIRLTKDSSFLAFFKAVKGVKPHLLVGLHQDLSKEGDYIAYSEKSVADEIKRLMPPSWGKKWRGRFEYHGEPSPSLGSAPIPPKESVEYYSIKNFGTFCLGFEFPWNNRRNHWIHCY